MIKVNVLLEKTGSSHPIKSLVVDGHAGSGPKGHDLVCAGVSAILIGGINALEEGQSAYDIEVKEGHVSIVNKNYDEKLNRIIHVILIQLKTIASSYPNHIKITENYN